MLGIVIAGHPRNGDWSIQEGGLLMQSQHEAEARNILCCEACWFSEQAQSHKANSACLADRLTMKAKARLRVMNRTLALTWSPSTHSNTLQVSCKCPACLSHTLKEPRTRKGLIEDWRPNSLSSLSPPGHYGTYNLLFVALFGTFSSSRL